MSIIKHISVCGTLLFQESGENCIEHEEIERETENTGSRGVCVCVSVCVCVCVCCKLVSNMSFQGSTSGINLVNQEKSVSGTLCMVKSQKVCRGIFVH